MLEDLKAFDLFIYKVRAFQEVIPKLVQKSWDLGFFEAHFDRRPELSFHPTRWFQFSKDTQFFDIDQISISEAFQIFSFEKFFLSTFLDELDDGPDLQIQFGAYGNLENGFKGNGVYSQVMLVGKEFFKSDKQSFNLVTRYHHTKSSIS